MRRIGSLGVLLVESMGMDVLQYGTRDSPAWSDALDGIHADIIQRGFVGDMLPLDVR